MANIFLSHSTIDGELANFLCESFESRGLSCWIAPRNIKPGEEWATSITNAILEADVFFILYSKHSIKSSQCAKEIGIADRKKKYILPYKIDDTEPEGAFDYYLTGCQWFIIDPSTGEYKIDELCDVIYSVIGKNTKNDVNNATASGAMREQQRERAVISPNPARPKEESALNVIQTAKPAPVSKNNSSVNNYKKTASKPKKMTQAQKERRNLLIGSICALLLVCLLVASVIGVVIYKNVKPLSDQSGGVFAGLSTTSEKDFTYEEINGGITITGYTGEAANVVIPAEINGMPVVSLSEKVFFQCETISSVELPETITGVPAYAFYKCSNLTNIVIPDGVTYIGNHAFEECVSLTTLQLPDSLLNIGDFAFNKCTNLTSVNMSRVESIGMYAFSMCKNLTEISLPSTVSRIGDMAFAYCTSLVSLTIPDGVEIVSSNAFAGCSNITVYYRGTAYTSDISGIFGY